MIKTKLIATYGPACADDNVLSDLIKEGISCVRINMSHADVSELSKLSKKIEKINKKLNTNVSIMVDLNGPDVRLNKIVDNSYLDVNTKIRIYRDNIVGNSTKFSTSYPNLIDDIEVGTIIKLGDGLIELSVVEKKDDYVIALVKNGGYIYTNMGLNVLKTKLRMPFLNKKDTEIIKEASRLGLDYLALSFVTCMEDVLAIQDLLIDLEDDHISLIAKIENEQGLFEVDEILKHVDGIMVARGDLGIEIGLEKLPIIQRNLIEKCIKNGKISIVATEMLASMIENPVPTRAEVTDIATSVSEGASAVMLSGESAKGKYPIEVVKTMRKIIEENEIRDELSYEKDITSIIARSVNDAVSKMDIKAIVAPTISGFTAIKISLQRPNTIVLALTPSKKVARQLSLYYGIIPIIVDELKNLDKLIELSRNIAKEMLDLKKGDYIIITGGYPFRNVKHTNFMKIEEI